jgi:hypothetical protein
MQKLITTRSEFYKIMVKSCIETEDCQYHTVKGKAAGHRLKKDATAFYIETNHDLKSEISQSTFIGSLI